MTKRYTVEFNAKITPVKPLNDEFTLCKCYVMALDKNRNLSYISKNAAEDAMPTLFNVPVIGHLYVDEDGKQRMGGHDMALAMDADGDLVFKSLCVPYGVVPQQDNIHFEDIQEPNGDIHTYIVSDVILWTGRFPELYEAIYSEDIYFGQSMEINVLEHSPLEEDKNYTEIKKYSYSALCLLGKSDNPEFHKEPCFPISRVEPYEFSLDDEFASLMENLKSELALCFENKADNEVENMNENETAAVQNEEEFTEDVTEVSGDAGKPVVEDTPEHIEDVSDASFEDEGDHGDDANPQHEAFASTYKEKREAIDNALPHVHEEDDDGVIRDMYFWVCDFDDTHVFVEKSEYRRDAGYGETKGRFAYTYNEDEREATITGEFEEMYVKWLTKDELDQIEEQRGQYEALAQYKADRERQDFESAIDTALSEFADLSNAEQFADIVADKYNFASVEALQDACYILRGKLATPAKPRTQSTEPTVPVGNNAPKVENLYTEFFERFGKKK